MFNREIYRAVAWLVAGLLAVIAWFSAPGDETPESWASRMSTADSTKIINDASTEGAP